MSFASPVLLLRCCCAARSPWSPTVRTEQGRRARAEAFAAPRMLESVAPRAARLAPARPDAALRARAWRCSRWPSHARGHRGRAGRARLGRPCHDDSGSMQARDVRADAARRPPARRRATSSTTSRAEVRVGAVIFNHTVRSIEAPTTDRAEVRRALDRLAALERRHRHRRGARPLAAAARASDRQRGRRPPAAIVLLSDGASTHGRDPLPLAARGRAAERSRSTPSRWAPTPARSRSRRRTATSQRGVPPDRETLRRLARDLRRAATSRPTTRRS